MLITSTETIDWIATQCGKHLPDSDTTVMVTLDDDDERVWLGYYDGERWVDATTGGQFGRNVIAWTDMPEGFRPPVLPSLRDVEELERLGQQRLALEDA